MTAATTIDVRTIVPRERHPLNFRTFVALGAGESFQLVNGHDPLPLHAQLQARYGAGVEITYRRREPGTIVIDFVKR